MKERQYLFPRKALVLTILTILDENPEGLSGYGIVKEVKQKFGLPKRISGGSIYPKLVKLRDKGYIFEEQNIFKITPEGKVKLLDNTEVIENSLEFMPMLYRTLMRPLPFKHRMKFLANMGPFLCGADPSMDIRFFDDLTTISEDLQSQAGLTRSLTELQAIKDQLVHLKNTIQERRDAQLKMIEERIRIIDEKIDLFHNEQKKWAKVIVEDEDKST